jgi:hypothetical protein
MPSLLKQVLGKTGGNDSDSQLAVNSYCELFAVVFAIVFLFFASNSEQINGSTAIV